MRNKALSSRLAQDKTKPLGLDAQDGLVDVPSPKLADDLNVGQFSSLKEPVTDIGIA